MADSNRKDELEPDEEETYWLQDFIFDTKKVPHPTILLVGKRFSGKSYTSVSVADKFQVPRWAAWCGTKDTEDFWAEKFESSASVKGPDEAGKSYLIKLIRYQQRKGRLYKKVLKLPFPSEYTIGMIFDDVTSKRKFRRGEILEDLFSNGRHYHAVIIISCQYLKQLPPAVRLNTDYLFMMHNTKRTIKVLYEDYVEEPDEFNMFLDLMRSVTGQRNDTGEDMFNSLVYDNVVKTSRLDEMFKVYRNEGADIIDNMKLGDEAWRTYNRVHYKDKDYELQKREYRKRKRLMRLQEYRQRQLSRRSNLGNPMHRMANALDIDYFSDSESEEETHDSITLTKRRGKNMTVNFSKGGASRASANSRATGEASTGSWNYPQASKWGDQGTHTGTGENLTATGYSIPDSAPIPDYTGYAQQSGYAPQSGYEPAAHDYGQGYSQPSYTSASNDYAQQSGYFPSAHDYGQQSKYGQQSSYGQGYGDAYGQQSGYGQQSSYGQGYSQPSYGQGYSQPSYAHEPHGYGQQSNYDQGYGAATAGYGQRYQKPVAPSQATSGMNTWSRQQNFIRNNSRYVPRATAAQTTGRMFL